MFFDDKFSVPTDWFAPDRIRKQSGGEVFYSELTKATQRKLCNCPVPFCEARVSSLEEEKEIFELINFGGVQQGEVDDDLICEAEL